MQSTPTNKSQVEAAFSQSTPQSTPANSTPLGGSSSFGHTTYVGRSYIHQDSSSPNQSTPTNKKQVQEKFSSQNSNKISSSDLLSKKLGSSNPYNKKSVQSDFAKQRNEYLSQKGRNSLNVNVGGGVSYQGVNYYGNYQVSNTGKTANQIQLETYKKAQKKYGKNVRYGSYSANLGNPKPQPTTQSSYIDTSQIKVNNISDLLGNQSSSSNQINSTYKKAQKGNIFGTVVNAAEGATNYVGNLVSKEYYNLNKGEIGKTINLTNPAYDVTANYNPKTGKFGETTYKPYTFTKSDIKQQGEILGKATSFGLMGGLYATPIVGETLAVSNMGSNLAKYNYNPVKFWEKSTPSEKLNTGLSLGFLGFSGYNAVRDLRTPEITNTEGGLRIETKGQRIKNKLFGTNKYILQASPEEIIPTAKPVKPFLIRDINPSNVKEVNGMTISEFKNVVGGSRSVESGMGTKISLNSGGEEYFFNNPRSEYGKLIKSRVSDYLTGNKITNFEDIFQSKSPKITQKSFLGDIYNIQKGNKNIDFLKGTTTTTYPKENLIDLSTRGGTPKIQILKGSELPVGVKNEFSYNPNLDFAKIKTTLEPFKGEGKISVGKLNTENYYGGKGIYSKLSEGQTGATSNVVGASSKGQSENLNVRNVGNKEFINIKGEIVSRPSNTFSFSPTETQKNAKVFSTLSLSKETFPFRAESTKGVSSSLGKVYLLGEPVPQETSSGLTLFKKNVGTSEISGLSTLQTQETPTSIKTVTPQVPKTTRMNFGIQTPQIKEVKVSPMIMTETNQKSLIKNTNTKSKPTANANQIGSSNKSQETGTRNILLTKQSNKSENRTKNILGLETKTNQKTQQKTRQIQKQSSKQKQLQKLLQLQQTKQIQTPINTNPSVNPVIPETKPTPNVLIPKLKAFGTSKESSAPSTGLFEIFGKVKKKDVLLGTSKTKSGAENLLANFLVGTLGASGSIKENGKSLKFKSLDLFQNPEFRAGKNNPFKVVQKRNKRLKKGGTEAQQIQIFRKVKNFSYI